jgi:hypothetical protein
MGILDDIFKTILGAAPAGVPIGASVSIPLGTGYNAAADVAAAVEKLTQLQREAIQMFPDQGATTFCNYGLLHVANGLGCHDLDGLMASEMVRRAELYCNARPQDWREDTWERAVAHAQRGGLAFVGEVAYPHGHVASVAAQPMQDSGTWGCKVPILANIGGAPPNDFKKLSACFRVAARPMVKTFLWRSA